MNTKKRNSNTSFVSRIETLRVGTLIVSVFLLGIFQNCAEPVNVNEYATEEPSSGNGGEGPSVYDPIPEPAPQEPTPIGVDKPIVTVQYLDTEYHTAASFTTQDQSTTGAKYQWQRKGPGENSFSDIKNGSGLQLSLSNLRYNQDNGALIRVKAFNGSSESYSDPKTIQSVVGDGQTLLTFNSGFNMNITDMIATTESKLVFQSDSNLVLYSHNKGKVIASLFGSNTDCFYENGNTSIDYCSASNRAIKVIFDGRIKLLNTFGQVITQSNNSTPGATLVLSGQTLSIKSSSGSTLWTHKSPMTKLIQTPFGSNVNNGFGSKTPIFRVSTR